MHRFPMSSVTSRCRTGQNIRWGVRSSVPTDLELLVVKGTTRNLQLFLLELLFPTNISDFTVQKNCCFLMERAPVSFWNPSICLCCTGRSTSERLKLASGRSGPRKSLGWLGAEGLHRTISGTSARNEACVYLREKKESF